MPVSVGPNKGKIAFVRILGWDENEHDVHKSCNTDNRPVILASP